MARKDKLPRIPSFAELGLTDEEVAELERETGVEAPPPGPQASGKPGSGRTEAAGSAAASAESGRPGPAKPGSAKQSGKRRFGKRRFGKRRFGKRRSGRTEAAGSAAASAASGPGASARSGPGQSGAGTPPSDAGASPATPASPKKPPPPPDDAPSPTAPRSAPAPWGGLRGLTTLVVLLLIAWFSSSYRSMPEPLPASAPETSFSSARAMTHLLRIASEARPPGSPAHERVRDYLVEELRRLGLEPQVQTTTAFRARPDLTRAATVRNILARIPGSEPGGRAVLVTAHYDSRGISVGAADDGAGVVAILEAVRALTRRAEMRNDLIVLFTDGEELGLLGARAFVNEHPWMGDVALVVGFEMRGGGGPSHMFETGENNGWVIDALQEADPYPAANSVGYEIYRRMPNDTDFTPFKEAGRQGLNFAGIGRAHVYHQVYDTPGSLSEATLQHHGEHALAMLEHFGAADLANVDAPNKTYMSLPLVGLIAYGRLWVWLVGFAAAGAWALAFVVARRRGARFRGVLAGAGGAAALIGATALGARYFVHARMDAHPEVGALHAGLFHSEGWYLMVVVCGAVALAVLATGILRRWTTAAELAVGALLLPAALALVATAMFPMGAMNLQWPVIGACLAVLAVAGREQGRWMGFWSWLAVLAGAAPVLMVLVPLIEGLWLAMGLGLAAAVGATVALALVMLFPVFDALREPNPWWAPVGAMMAGGAFLAAGVTLAGPSADRPTPSTLVYALDRESGTAWWGTDPSRGETDPGTIWAEAAVGPFGVTTGAGAGAGAEAGQAAEADGAAAGGGSPAQDSLRAFTPGGRVYAVAVANAVEIAAPLVEVLGAAGGGAGDEVEGATVGGAGAEADAGSAAGSGLGAGGQETGVIRVAVRSAIGAEMLLFRFDDANTRPVAVNGRRLPPGAFTGRIEHWGAPAGSVLLDFARGTDGGPIGGALRFTVIEHHLRPGELVGDDRFRRPPELAPNTRTQSDRAMIRTRVELEG